MAHHNPTEDLLEQQRTLEQADVSFVDLPMAELRQEQRPRLLRKANSAVHLHPVQGRFSLVMRRAFNALLALAHRRLRELSRTELEALFSADRVVRFEASATDVKVLMGWGRSGDYESVYETLDELQRLQVVWDVMDDREQHWTEKTTLLSQWGRTNTGRLSWLWVPDLFTLLFHPESPYTPVDLELTWAFNSGYTLALYENTFRYRKIRHTPWRPVSDWRLLIAGPDLYKDYREFKRTVLKTAMRELEQTANCPIRVELEERRGPCNRVEALRFIVHTKEQVGLPVQMPAQSSPELLRRMTQLGVSAEKARELLRQHDEAYLRDQLALVNREIARRQNRGAERLTNPAGFFVRAVEQRYQDEVVAQEQKTQKLLAERRRQERASELRKRWAQLRYEEALRWHEQRSERERNELLQEFLAQAPPFVREQHARKGLHAPAVRFSYLDWLIQNRQVLHSEEARDILIFTAAQSAESAVT